MAECSVVFQVARVVEILGGFMSRFGSIHVGGRARIRTKRKPKQSRFPLNHLHGRGNLADAGKAVLHSFLGCRIQKIMSSKSSWRSCKPLLCLIVLSNGGCTGTPSQRPSKLYDVRWAPVESWFDSILGDTEQDRLWKQGYGFNNPNAERIRKERPK